MFYMHDAGWGWWLLISVGMVAFWGLIVVAVVWFIRRQPTELGEAPPRETPDEIVRRRLAEGEISMDEYERLREVLHARPHSPVAA
jgi:putative membrane protein